MVSASAAPSGVTALSYVVMDAESGQILFGQNMDQQYDPASITKIMTLALACEKAQGDWSTELTVSYDAVASIANTGSSHIALQVGEVISLEDALYAVMMASANDAANVLAEYIGGDIAGGVAAMNVQVEALGLENTHFDNPHGLTSDTHKVSAADMAEILRWAMEQEGFMTLFTNNETYIMQPTNLQEEERYFSISDSVRIGSSQYYVPEVIGSKTGYTDASRYTYAAVAESDGRTFICVTLHSEEKVDRYNDAKTLFDYAFEHFTKVEIAAENTTFSVDVYGGDAKLGEASASASGTSFYLYDATGADTITWDYQMDDAYIIGSDYDAVVVYSLPESSNQASFDVEVPMTITGIQAILQVNQGIALPAAASLVPTVHRAAGGVLVVVLVLLGVLAAAFFGYCKVTNKGYHRRKSPYQRVHRYNR